MQADWRDTGEPFGVNGHRYGARQLQRSTRDEPDILVGLLTLPLMLVVGLIWWWLRHPVTTMLSVLLIAAWLYGGVILLITASFVLVAVLLAWWWLWPHGFERFVTNRARTMARSWWIYRRRWHATMVLTGLAGHIDATDYEPGVRKIRCGRYVDHVQVRMLTGQQPEHWDVRADALAHTFGALTCRVRSDGPGRLCLDFLRNDPLAQPIPALPMPTSTEDVDLEAVPVGSTEDGLPWDLRLTGTSAAHLLIGGSSGSGKSSLVWSLLRGLGPAISSGLVQVWAVDPKGGMELAPGLPLFTRFGYGTPEQLAELITEAESLVHQRTNRLRGHVRHHTPCTDDPLVVLVVDEIASITSYLIDRQVAKQIMASLSVILSQGRAAGVVVVGAVQDPRKDIIPFRDLFTARVGLRMTEANQADMILGDGARLRGATCEHIPENQPGTGYVLIDGHREPIRVRAAQVTDADIQQLAALHAAPVPTSTVEPDVDAELAVLLSPGSSNGQDES